MTENPYEAPRTQSPRVERKSGLEGGTGTFDIGRCLNEMWAVGKENAGLLIGGGLLLMVLYLVSAITVIGYFLLVPIFLWGAVRMGLNMVDSRASLSDLFAGFQDYGANLGRMLMVILLMLLLGIGCASVQLVGTFLEEPALMLVGSLISMVLQFTVVVRFAFAPLYVVDQGMSGTDALSASWRAMRGNVLKLIALGILSYIITMLGLLALLVGILFTAPLSYLMFVSAYRQVVGRPARAAA